jgi:hypothetical protein
MICGSVRRSLSASLINGVDQAIAASSVAAIYHYFVAFKTLCHATMGLRHPAECGKTLNSSKHYVMDERDVPLIQHFHILFFFVACPISRHASPCRALPVYVQRFQAGGGEQTQSTGNAG